jgi:hypothetical protein
MYPNEYTLELMYNKSIQNNALICGGSLNKIKKINGSITISNSSEKYMFYREEMTDYFQYQFDFGFYRFIYNSKLIKKNKIHFPKYIRYQDPPFFIKAMLMAKNFYALNYTTYLYRKSHKNIKWNKKKIIDQYNGFNDCLVLSEKNRLNKLYCTIVQRLNLELFIYPTNEFINDIEVKSLIFKIINRINFTILKNINCKFTLNEIYKQFVSKNLHLEWFS